MTRKDIPKNVLASKMFGPKVTSETISPGRVIYFPVCRTTSKPTAPMMTFNGIGFGVFLGVVPPRFPEPTPAMVPQLMATIGYVAFEDVIEFLGDDAFKTVEEKFRAKYEPPAGEETAESAEPPAMPEPPRLVGVDGKPIA
jgi:hypothetical protein